MSGEHEARFDARPCASNDEARFDARPCASKDEARFDARPCARQIPDLVVDVTGRAGVDAALRCGADKIVLDGRTVYDAAAASRDVNFGIVRSCSLAAIVEKCMSASVGVRLAVTGTFPVRRFNAILNLAAEMAEMGVSEVELSDFGLAAAFRYELPDLSLVFRGGPVMNSGYVALVSRAGFKTVVFDSRVAVGDIETIIGNSDISAEIPVFGLRTFAWCGACMAGEYFDSSPCNGNVFGPCRRVFTAERGISGGRLLDDGFFSGLVVMPDIIRAGAGSVRLDVRNRRSDVVAEVTAVFRDAVDAARRTIIEEGPDALGTDMYPADALHFWNGRLVHAALHGDVVPVGSTPGGSRAACFGRRTVRCGIASRLARFIEPIAIDMENVRDESCVGSENVETRHKNRAADLTGTEGV